MSLQAGGIPTIAGVLSIASSSGSIIKEGHDLTTHFKVVGPFGPTTHFKVTMKKHGADLKRAFKGKPPEPPNPVAVPEKKP